MFDSPLITAAGTEAFWSQVTRLGEAQILLPAAVLALWALWAPGRGASAGRALALWWLGLLGGAVALTTATKVAFIGWGLGWAAIDFTGISGHAMFAAAVYPLLLGTLAPDRPLFAPRPRLPGQPGQPGQPAQPAKAALVTWRWVGVSTGAAVALMVGISRVMIGVHSVSEVEAGLALGGAVSALALWRAGLAGGYFSRWKPALAALAALWLAVMPAVAPASQTHPLVTRLALKLAGHQQPHMRDDWLREWRARRML